MSRRTARSAWGGAAWRWALATALWIVPTIALGQDEGDAAGQVSNDQPGRPLQMPPASGEVKEALDDFERFRRRGAWERALKALYTIPDDQIDRFVDGEDGFIIRVAHKRRSLLATLPPEGQAAHRLFYDAEAQKLFDEADGASERETLERLYSSYFPTSVGDDAADRLGDLYFERGWFDRAAACWLAVVREHPDSNLAPGQLAVKAAIALSRAGRRSEWEAIRTEITERYADEQVTIGGRTGSAEEILRQFLEAEPAGEPDPGAAEGPLVLDGREKAVWQVRFGASIVAGMTPIELDQWESNALSAAVPAVAIGGDRLFANYLGHVFAVDLASGKMLWRSAAFHQVDVAAAQNHARVIDPGRFAIVASEDYVWSLSRDLKDPNYFASFRLVCRRVDVGDVVWQSSDLPDYAEFDLISPPLLARGMLYIAAKTLANQPQQPQRAPAQYVLAIQPWDGKVLWKAEVGTLRQDQQRYYYYGPQMWESQPRLVCRAGSIYVDTHLGVLARLDAETGAVDWGYGYPTEPAQSEGRFFIRYNPSQAMTASSRPLEAGQTLLVKGAKSDRIGALDPDRRELLWDRPIAKASRLLGVVGGAVFLGGPELDAMDLESQRLLWSIRLPGGSADGRLLVRPDGLWQLTPRGIFEIEPTSGQVRRIFRGEDTGSTGGDLFLTDCLLLAVSNRTISAYDRRPTGSAGPEITEGGETDDE